MDPLSRWRKHKEVIRLASRCAIREMLSGATEDPFLKMQAALQAGRALFFNNFDLAAKATRTFPMLRSVMGFSKNNGVWLTDPQGFHALVSCTVRGKLERDERGIEEEETNAPKGKFNKELVNRRQHLERWIRLWLPFGRQLIVRGGDRRRYMCVYIYIYIYIIEGL